MIFLSRRVIFILLSLFVSICLQTIVNTPGVQYIATNEILTGSNWILSGYPLITITNCTFSNAFIQITQSTNVSVLSNSFGNYSGVSALTVTNPYQLSVLDNVFAGGNSGRMNISRNGNTTVCFLRKYEVALYVNTFFPFSFINSVSFKRNTLQIQTGYHPSSLFAVNYNDTGTEFLTSTGTLKTIQSYEYEFNSIVYTQPNVFTVAPTILIGGTNQSNQTIGWCLNPYSTNITIGNSTAHHASTFLNSRGLVIASGTFRNNTITSVSTTETVISTILTDTTTTSASNGTIQFAWDSMIHIRDIHSPSLFSIGGNYMSHTGITNGILSPPVRVGLLLTNTSNSNTIAGFSLNSAATVKFQYVAKMLLDQNERIFNSYSHDVQVEANPSSDAYSGWNECHNTCRRNCTACYLVDSIQHAYLPQFSSTMNGVCYQAQAYSTFEAFASNCPHEDALVTSPYDSNSAVIWSSGNLVNGVLHVQPDGLNNGPVVFNMNDTLTVSDTYKTVIHPRLFYNVPDTSFFTFTHPFIIMTRYNGTASTVLQNLTFTGISFVSAVEGTNRAFFSSMIYDNGYLGGSPNYLNLLEFTDCSFLGYKVGNPFFFVGAHLLKVESTEVGFISTLSTLHEFVFTNNNYTWLDTLFSTALNQIEIDQRLYIAGNLFEHTENGIFYGSAVIAPIITFTSNRIIDSYANGGSKAFFWITGIETNTLIINDNQFDTMPSISIDPTTTTRVYEVKSFGTLDFSSNYADGFLGVGLSFTNISNYPCNYSSLVALENLNMNLNGSVHDVMCTVGISPLPYEIGCKKDNCYVHPSLRPAFCIVDSTYPQTGPLWRIQYFYPGQFALDRCIAGSTTETRIILWAPTVIVESELNIHNYHATETLYLGIYDSTVRPLIVGKNHVISPSIGSKFNLTIDGLNFLNPTGLLTYTSTPDNAIITALTNIDTISFTIKNTKLIAVQPISTIGVLPTTFADWNTLANTLTAHGVVAPNIRYPNVRNAIVMVSKGDSRLENVEFFGSTESAYQEFKVNTRTTTTILNVTGENAWTRLLKLDNMWDVTINDTTCIYFCGGLYSIGIAASIADVSMLQGGAGFKFWRNNFQAGVVPSGNPYVLTRFQFGNPYTGFLNAQVGYLAGLNLLGAYGSEWNEFKIRQNIITGFPLGVRMNAVNASVLALNDVSVYLNDAKRLPRQIQWENDHVDPTVSIHGTLHDIKFGVPFEDAFTTSSNVCDAMCLPPPSNLVCQVSVVYVIPDVQHFNSLTEAIRLCPYDKIYVMDAVFYENVNTNFVYTVSRLGSTLTIIFYTGGGGVLIGHHRFVQDCVLPTETIPTLITWRTVEFQLDVNSSAVVIDFVPSHVSCIQTKIAFETVQVTKTVLNLNAETNAIQCIGCTIGNITFDTTTILGDFTNGIYVSSSIAELVTTGVTIGPVSRSAIYVNDVQGIVVWSNTLRCNNPVANSTEHGCLNIKGSTSLLRHSFQTNEIYSNQAVLVADIPFDAFYWDLEQSLSFSQVLLMCADITETITAATGFGIRIISDGIDSEYPCAPTSDTALNTIQTNNPLAKGTLGQVIIMDDAGVILNLIANSAVQTFCFLFDNQRNTPVEVFEYFLYAAIGGGIFFLLFIFSRGCECICGMSSWLIQKDYTPLYQAESTRRLEVVQQTEHDRLTKKTQ